MRVEFLGTGTSQGVPFIGCPCSVCTSLDKRDYRLRCSVWIRTENTSIVIDTGPDFRYQALRAKIDKIDAVIYTHGHKDHVAGLDDIKAFNYWQNSSIDLYANKSTEEVLRREFHYVFNGDNYPGIPVLHIQPMLGEPFVIGDLEIIPIKVMHYKLEVYGFRIGDFTYITDANYIADSELAKAKGSKALVLNALRHEKHISHFTLEEAKQVAKEIGATQTYFTHISHQLGLYTEMEPILDDNVHLAYDGLVLEF